MHFWLAENKSIIIIIIIIYYYYYYSIIMQHACKVVKQVRITNCTHTFIILSVLTHYNVFSYTWLTSNNMTFLAIWF